MIGQEGKCEVMEMHIIRNESSMSDMIGGGEVRHAT